MSRRGTRILLAAGALALLGAVPAFAAGISLVTGKLTSWQSATSVPVATCSSPGSVTASSVADSWIDQSAALVNKGTDAIVRVRSLNGQANFRTLIRFTLPAAPTNCTLTSATLRLYAASATSGRTLQALRVNATWTESTVNWSIQPATTGTAATVTSGTGYRTWTVTTQVASMYSGSNFGFLIRDATEGQSGEQQFHAREKGSDNPPQLVVTFG